MGKVFVLVTGGSASGKSEYAEQRITQLRQEGEPLIYLATMEPYGREGAARVEKHRKQRAKRQFETLEWYRNLVQAPIPPQANVLLECMSNLAANEMFGEKVTEISICEERILTGVTALQAKCHNLVIVTNEVFSDTMSYDETTREYIRLLGHVNAALADKADEVIEVVYGIPVLHKLG